MAILTNADIAELWGPFYEIYQTDIKAEGASGFLSVADVKELFQAIEDWYVNGYNVTPTSAFKDSVIADLTNWATVTNTFLQAASAAWYRWKAESKGF